MTSLPDTAAAPATSEPMADEEQRLRQIERNQALIALLESWRNTDEAGVQDQIETWEFLQKVLDEDRLSDRKLFP